MYERILVPTDGSQGVHEAVDRAIDLALTYDAELHAVYVVETEAFSREVGPASMYDRLEAHGEEAVDAAVERAEAAGVDTVKGSIAEGRPHRAILDYADDRDVDLIVMGTHGCRGIDRYLLGSVTEKVVRAADVPVLTVRMNGDSAE